MKIHLPSRLGGTPEVTLPAGCRNLIVVGANGAGKSRFAARLAEGLGERAFRTSALEALYSANEDASPTSIDGMYRELAARSPMLRRDLDGGFERLVALLLDQETRRMFALKYGVADVQDHSPSAVERLAASWEEIFPGNKMLLASGSLLFSNRAGSDLIDAPRLSDGEKAVIYHLGAALMAPAGCVTVVDAPEMFLHPASMSHIWDTVERLTPDCERIYVTHDLGFASARAQRADTAVVWVKGFDALSGRFDYEMLPAQSALGEELYAALMGSRKPVMFIEGDGVNSIDAKLYPLVFREYDVRSLGSCNRVIEATRTFNDLSGLHNLEAVGIVDRDRRNEHEVAYLRRRKVMVPEVAEIENLLMLEEVVKAVARRHRRSPEKVFAKVRKQMIQMFRRDKVAQALQHTRHRVKVDAEHTIDRRFSDIGSLERHLAALQRSLNPRAYYEGLLRDFDALIESGDYAGILKVFNHKSMLGETNVAGLCGIDSSRKGAYMDAVIEILREDSEEGRELVSAIRRVFS